MPDMLELPRISFAVMAHPLRSDTALALGALLACPVVFDDGCLEITNGNRAWAAYDPDASWHCVIQDDALPIAGFTTQLQAALAIVPQQTCVSLYTGTGRPMPRRIEAAVGKALRAGASWLSSESLHWGVGVAMPTSHIDDFLGWSPDDDPPYDERIGMFWRELGAPILYAQPSLVDHADGASLVLHRRPPAPVPRRAWTLGPSDAWNQDVIPI